MPRVSWGGNIDADEIDNWDRSEASSPYIGPVPPSGRVYQWRIATLKHVPAVKGKHPQLRVGLELAPRKGYEEEKAYYDSQRKRGYYVMAFLSLSENNKWLWVPFLDAIGVSGKDFKSKTEADQDGNIRKIGKWINNGKQLILGRLSDDTDENGQLRKRVNWFGAVDEDALSDDDDDYLAQFDDEYDDEEDEEEDEPF